MIKEEDYTLNEQEYCVCCRQSIAKDSDNFINYGKICFYFSCCLTDILKKKPEEIRK